MEDADVQKRMAFRACDHAKVLISQACGPSRRDRAGRVGSAKWAAQGKRALRVDEGPKDGRSSK
eukprot:8792040-Pyramimonas_sp.AAC.1